MIKLGLVVHDTEGAAWVYVGFRLTLAETHSHQFAKAFTGKPWRGPFWEYQATSAETLKRKFPDLEVSDLEIVE